MSFVSLIAGFLSGVIGAMGLGGGAVLLIYLRVFADIPVKKAQGINLLFFLPIALIAVIIYAFKKKIDFKLIWPMAAGGAVGSIGGSLLLGVFKPEIIGKVFAVFLIFMGVKEIIFLLRLLKQKKCGIVKKE